MPETVPTIDSRTIDSRTTHSPTTHSPTTDSLTTIPTTGGIIDVDQHYYEPDDCASRHLEAAFRGRGVTVTAAADGQRQWCIGERPVGFERWVRDVTLAPGVLRRPAEDPLVTTDRPEFRDRDARLRLLDGWGIEAAVMLPTSGLGWDAEMQDDPLAAAATARAFNRWVEQEWGFAYRDRLFAPPFLSLADIDEAVRELNRVLAAGARMILLRTGPVHGRSPADPCYDRFWALVNEARVPVVLHISTSGYEREFARMWGEDPAASHRTFSAFQWFTSFATRPVVDTLASMIFHNLFGRFPDVRVVSVENGSRWVAPMLHDLAVAHRFVDRADAGAAWLGGRLTEAPAEVFRRHVYVAPYLTPGYDAPVADLVALLGAERVVYGSDWPHGEGMPSPLDYLPDLAPLDPGERRSVLRGNVCGWLGLPA